MNRMQSDWPTARLMESGENARDVTMYACGDDVAYS